MNVCSCMMCLTRNRRGDIMDFKELTHNLKHKFEHLLNKEEEKLLQEIIQEESMNEK